MKTEFPQISPLDRTWLDRGQSLMNRLTMPPRAMGELMNLAAKMIAQQQTLHPRAERFTVVPFCADHGMVRAEITNSPRSVTALVTANMAKGDATVTHFARLFGGTVLPVNMGICNPLPPHLPIRQAPLGPMTADFTAKAAMTVDQCDAALQTGIDLAFELADSNDLFVLGEMGVGNTTAATALCCALLKQPAAELTGFGSGIDENKRQSKIALIDSALAFHEHPSDPFEILRRLGGFELAALVGFTLGAAACRRAVVLDGFVTACAACIAFAFAPRVKDWLFAAHLGAERGHARALEYLGLKAPLNLGLKLGEGAGGVLALPLLRAACELCTLPTFEESGVPEGIPGGVV